MGVQVLGAVLIWAGLATAAKPELPAVEAPCRPLPRGFVRLHSALPGLRLEVRYATADNFTGAPLPGYAPGELWALAPVAEALALVRADLAEDGLDILIYDAYRPQRASAAMVAWTRRTGQTALLREGYIAARSGHNHGHTVDLTLVQRDGSPLDMGGAWDAFSPVSHVGAATGAAAAHRARLQQAMTAAGFVPYSKEWWHFRLPLEGTTPVDLPYGCAQPERFVAPEGWDEPGWTPPSAEQ